MAGSLNTSITAWNGHGRIGMADNAFASPNSVARTVYHEIAHNWDEQSENRFVRDFRAVAGWFQTPFGINPNGLIPGNWERAAGASWSGWWFVDKNANLDGFAWTYGKENPLEDFATSFAAYVAAATGAPHAGNTFESPAAVSSRLAQRFSVLDEFFASMS